VARLFRRAGGDGAAAANPVAGSTFGTKSTGRTTGAGGGGGETSVFADAGSGGKGGDGGYGGDGGVGGTGGKGGTGGGGAGGTIKLYGTALSASQASVSYAGGTGSVAGGAGRLILGSNTSLSGNEPVGQLAASTVLRASGPQADNPYIAGVVSNAALNDTPYVANLQGGADIFGLLDGVTKTTLINAGLLGTIPDNALAAVIRLDIGPGTYGSANYAGMDMLLFVNLSNGNLSTPQIGVTLAGSAQSDLLRNLQIDGVGSLQDLGSLGAGQVWATLIPDQALSVNAKVAGSIAPFSARTMIDNQVEFIRAVQPATTQSALGSLDAIAASPDGRHLYAVSSAGDALVVINADDLSERQLFKNGFDGFSGLDGASDVAVSADGLQVFVTSALSRTLLIFTRDASSGNLSNPITAVNSGPYGAFDTLATNAAGNRVFTAGPEYVFSYDNGGNFITYSGLGGLGELAVSQDNTLLFGSHTTTDSLVVLDAYTLGQLGAIDGASNGLSGLDGIAVSANDQQVYVAASGSDAIAVFVRNGVNLTLREIVRNNADGVRGLDGVTSVALSADGRYVFATGAAENAVAVFRRDAADGSLQFVQVVRNGVGGVGGMLTPTSIASDAHGIYVGNLGQGGFAGGVVKFDLQTLAGNALQNRPELDGWTGSVTILDASLSDQQGTLDTWSVFNNSAAGRVVTPLLLAKRSATTGRSRVSAPAAR
jgi:6-phosphogluconolactonase (cycloisomerase 2 family)